MDLKIGNIPSYTNSLELRLFLVKPLLKFKILAFESLRFTAKMRPTSRWQTRKKPGGSCNVKVLDEEELKILSKQATQSSHADATKTPQSPKPIPFISCLIGVWDYNHLEKLVFDQKHKKKRRGTISFGRSALVVFLKGAAEVEDVDESDSTPHLKNASFRSPNGKNRRLIRETTIHPGSDTISALGIMVYRFQLRDAESAHRAWSFVSKSSALPRPQTWKSMVSMMARFIPYINELCQYYGPEYTARGVRKLQSQVPVPGPEVEAERLTVKRVVEELRANICYCQRLEDTAQKLVSKGKQHRHLVSTYKATITPIGVLLRGPDPIISNRVLRKYADKSEYFLRVSFTDEDGVSVTHNPRVSQEFVYWRLCKTLRKGFLEFSQSSLRCHTAWFMAPFDRDGKRIESKHVIEDLGDFSHIKCSAQCAARIGQAFSDTLFVESIAKDVYVTEMHPDKLRPTVLQIRYRGAKGVISLDKSLVGKQLLVRKSMTKYKATESWRDLEVCGAAYKPLPMFLGHQLIKILEDLGVPHQNSEVLQDAALRELEMMYQHPINAATHLQNFISGLNAKVPTLLRLFLRNVVELAVMTSPIDLRYRARIRVQDGYHLYGVMDETNELREAEVYIVTGTLDENGQWRRETLVRDRVVITRVPALHPDDVQVVRAVDVAKDSPLQHLHNLHRFLPARAPPPRMKAPSNYHAAPARNLKRTVQMNDMVDFFMGTKHPICINIADFASEAVDFSKSGQHVTLGRIPKSDDSYRPEFMASPPNLFMNDTETIELAEEDSEANDPLADSVSILDPETFHSRHYKSSNILGKLFRRIDEASFFSRLRKNPRILEKYVDKETTLVQWEPWRGFAEELRKYYSENMLEFMEEHRLQRDKPLTEVEVFCGKVLSRKQPASTRSIYEVIYEVHPDVRERFNRDVSNIARRIVSGDGQVLEDERDEALPRAIACVKISLETDGWKRYEKLKSWKYVTAAVCLEELKRYKNGQFPPL
ncbi:RdRP-domain-containing protein [Lentithecium fluviatile CBS 122367]|uniref:RNA-dependent RNA polymerase n=1 Tax=Lentithecium fluviatile CBS 122367 TaxID=1168545 RepID=A0A6G1J669_9PLEO|nr:RdRP-domain-containing protein [Lentithecium fluviatile CBS 122367]